MTPTRHVVSRDGLRDLAFTGALLARHEGADTVELYRTEGERYVVTVRREIHRSAPFHGAAVAPALADIVPALEALLGSLTGDAKRLLAKAGLDELTREEVDPAPKRLTHTPELASPAAESEELEALAAGSARAVGASA